MEDIFNVVEFILHRESIKHPDLQRLLFYIQVEALNQLGEPAFDSLLETRTTGPTFTKVYDKYQFHRGIGLLPSTEIPPQINEKLKQIVIECMDFDYRNSKILLTSKNWESTVKACYGLRNMIKNSVLKDKWSSYYF